MRVTEPNYIQIQIDTEEFHNETDFMFLRAVRNNYKHAH